jgi:hypothetical protein
MYRDVEKFRFGSVLCWQQFVKISRKREEEKKGGMHYIFVSRCKGKAVPLHTAEAQGGEEV